MVGFLENLTEFEVDGKTLYFVRYHEKSKRIIYWERNKEYGSNVDTCKHMPISQLSSDTLKELKIWDELTEKDRSAYEKAAEVERVRVSEKMENARRGRKNRFPNIPDEMTCKTCGKVQKVQRSVTAAKIEKLGVLLDDYLKEWECQKCHPTKGRKANPEFAHLPKELVCKCGNKVSTSPSAIVAKAKKLKITPEEVVEQYQCQTCNPTKGRGKRGKRGKK